MLIFPSVGQLTIAGLSPTIVASVPLGVSIDWPTGVITILQSDASILTNLSGTLYGMDTSAFRLALKALEQSDEGVLWPDTHRHNTIVTISGVNYVRTIEIINGYSIVFVPDAQWTVIMDGASNNNFHDVAGGILAQNQVQVIPSNSAGNTITETGVSGLTEAEALNLADQNAILSNRRESDPITGIETIYEADGVTVRFTRQLYENVDGTQTYRGSGVERSDRLEP